MWLGQYGRWIPGHSAGNDDAANQRWSRNVTAATVAKKVGLPPEQVFKTLCCRGDRKGVCLAVVPGDANNDGALGNEDFDSALEPVPVSGGLSFTVR